MAHVRRRMPRSPDAPGDAARERRRLPVILGIRPASGRDGRGHLKWHAVVAAIVTLGSFAAVFGSTTWYSYATRANARSVAHDLAGARAVLGSSLQRDADLLSTVNAVVATHPRMDGTLLGELLARLRVADAYPGAFSFSYIERLTAPQLPAFLRLVRREPPLGIPIPARESTPSVRAPGRAYCLTRLATIIHRLPAGLAAGVAPFLAAYVGPAHDYCSSPVAPLLAWSARSGDVAVTPASRVAGSAGTPGSKALGALLRGRSVFAMASPVYAGATLPTSRAARSRALEGWTLGLFDASAILRPVAAGADTSAALLAYRSPGGAPEVLARSGHLPAGAPRTAIEVAGGGAWVVELTLRDHPTLASPGVESLFIALGGLLVTALLAALVAVLVRSRRSAVALAERRTEELRYQALHDPLTGLPNRLLVGDRARELLAGARADGSPVAALLIDLDDFKVVNDNLGHRAGDELLEQLALRLTQSIGPRDTVGRIGGDEFLVLVADPSAVGGVDTLARTLAEVVAEPFSLAEAGRGKIVLSASIGVATGARLTPDDLLLDADIALYRAKAAGKGRHVAFDPEMREAATRKLSLEADLHDALANRELFLVYQPIVGLGTGDVSGVEALLRWRHPSRGVVGPEEFIPILESSDLIVDVGRFVLRESCRQARTWQDSGWALGVSVNVAARQLRYDSFTEHVRDALEESGLDPRRLSLELTESMLLADTAATARRLRALKRLGVQIAIDDFGTGYSSLSYLREFPVDVLKIDRSFVARLDSPEGGNFLDALIHLGRYLGLSTIAEGVEEESQLSHLRREQCEWGQGFLFSRPVEGDAVLAVVASLRAAACHPRSLAWDRA